MLHKLLNHERADFTPAGLVEPAAAAAVTFAALVPTTKLSSVNKLVSKFITYSSRMARLTQ